MTQWPDLAALELLQAIADEGSLGGASRRLGQAEPNVSRSLARLERRTGLPLVQRSARGSVLTAEGAAILAAARPLLRQAQVFQRTVAEMGEGARTRLVFAASQTIAEHLAPAWVATMHRRRPEVEVSMRVTNSAAVVAMVEAHEVALGFVEAPVMAESLRSKSLREDRLVVVVDPRHPWARHRRPITLREVADASLVVREAGSGTRDTLDAAITRDLGADVHGHVGVVLSSNAAVLGACAAGAGPAVLSEWAVGSAVATGTVVPVALDHPEALSRELRAVWSTDRLSVATSQLIAIASAT